MSMLSFQSVLRIIQTILNVLVAALTAIQGIDVPKDDSEG